MKTISRNPIYEFINDLIRSGKTTKERLCVAADLKYHTFDNMFDRPTVSQLIKKSLQFSGILPKKIVEEYEFWVETVYKPMLRKEREANARNENAAARTQNKRRRKVKGDEAVGDNADEQPGS